MKHLCVVLTLAVMVTLMGCSNEKQERVELPYIESSVGEGLIPVKYLGDFRTNKAFCKALINGMAAINNYKYDSGTITTGFNATAFLENGENTIGVYFASLDARQGIEKHREGARCELVLTGNTPTDAAEVSSIVATADAEGMPRSVESPDYPARNKTGKVEEPGYLDEDSLLYEMERTITVNNLPEWAWTRATPLEDTPENFQRLQEAYLKLNRILANNDLDAFKKSIWLLVTERGYADGYSPELMFSFLGMEQEFEKGMTEYPIKDWSQYEFKSFKGGRLVRLANENDVTPGGYVNSEGRKMTFDVYFSMIDGQLVITR